MRKRQYKQWEDIYPLTLIQMRYGGKYVAINCEEDSGHIQDVNTEEVHYHLEEWFWHLHVRVERRDHLLELGVCTSPARQS